MTLEEACAACADTVAYGQRLSVTLVRVVYDEEALRMLRELPLAADLVDPNLEVGAIRWVARLQLPQEGSTLEITASGRTIEEAQVGLTNAMAEALTEEERARMS